MAVVGSRNFHGALEWVTVLGFLGTLTVVGACSLLPQRSAGGKTTSLGATIAPQLSPQGLSQLPTQFRAYFDEHFAFRPELVRAYGLLNVRVLRTSSSDEVVLGKQGWLFFSGDNGIRDYRSVKPFSNQELETWAATLERRRQWLAARGCRYVFTVVPNSQTIYSEYLPETINRVRQESRLDQLLTHLRAHTQVTAVDLRPALFTAKRSSEHELYHRTDTHWNPLGAFYGYQELARSFKSDFPTLRPLSRADFEVVTRVSPGGDLARMLGLQPDLQEKAVEVVWKKPRRAQVVGTVKQAASRDMRYERLLRTACPGAPISRVVMFRDSQAGALIPYLGEHFGQATYVWTDNDQFDCSLVEQEHPQLVIEEIVERKLMRAAPASQPCEMNGPASVGQPG